MRILLDENLPFRLVRVLRDLGHDVEHVYTKKLGGEADPSVRHLAAIEDRFLITQDIRFGDLLFFASEPHPGFMLVRLKNASLTVLFDRLQAIFRSC
jgi:predicted nuclease of predicted toxin-antitoxin system